MNRTLLVGRLTAEPQLRTTASGVAVVQTTIAVNRMPNTNGERVSDFINVVIWRKQAENVSKYCSKGSLLGIEGRLQSRSYDGQDGKKRYVTEVIADNVTFLGNKPQRIQSTQPVQTQEPAQVQATVEENPFASFSEEVVLNEEDLPWLQ